MEIVQEPENNLIYIIKQECLYKEKVVSSPLSIPSSETQGQSVGSGEKAERKFSSTGKTAPG